MTRFRTHTIVRAAFLIFFAWTCWRLFAFYQWAMGHGGYVPHPDATAGFVPLGAVMGLLAWLRTGVFDPIIPAAEVIILGALAVSLLFKKGFCGWICPVGSTTSIFGWLGRKLFGKNYNVPRKLDVGLRVPKYVIAGLIVVFLGLMPAANALEFQKLPYYSIADLKILLLLLNPNVWFIGLVLVVGATSVFWGNTWCRYFCPVGALYGAVGAGSAGTVTRNAAKCVSCGACSKACVKRVDVETSKTVRAPECDGCLDCVNACPEPGALSARFLGFSLPAWAWPLLVVGAWLLIWVIAVATGHWYHGASAATIAGYIKQM
jgi:polyferredoxin